LESPEQSLELPELPEPLEQLEPLVPQSALEPAGQALAAQGPVQQLVLVLLAVAVGRGSKPGADS